ncbi:hypothetical protein PS854_05537 [Pseudomonas fluorescens]|jgi:IS5 family transposase|uniref:Uncharacterized protein n=1 Tax=Pseudomonas fluorescens TaxID=294 RepID=A0A5E7PXF3_PSEFL|nr:hypothetical protein PS854_05537 [Pseudomonas fluorescens]
MNSWDDQKVRDVPMKNGRYKVIVSGLRTKECDTTFALSAMGLSLREGIIVDAKLNPIPCSTKTKQGKRDTGMHLTKKGNQY